MKKIEKKNNMGGLLVMATLSFILMLVISFNSISKSVLPFSFNKTWIAISDLSLDSYNIQWIQFVIFKFASEIFTVLCSIVLFILFYKQSKYLPTTLVIYFLIRVLLLAFSFYFQTITRGPASPTLLEITGTSFKALIIPSLWIPYIMLSEKARDSFIY